MWKIKIAALFVLSAPLYAQRGELYALGGYSRTWESDVSGFCSSCFRSQAPSTNGGFFGAGIGARVIGIFGVQGEFFQSRGSALLPAPSLNTGALNLVLEKRTGRFRPGGIVLGIGGAGSRGGGYIFAQWAAGVAVMLTEKVYIRPQLRVQGWTQIFNHDRESVSAAVALGYRF